jgi:hypothetical protein
MLNCEQRGGRDWWAGRRGEGSLWKAELERGLGGGAGRAMEAGSYLAPAAAAARGRRAWRPRRTGRCGSSGCRQRGAPPQSREVSGPFPGQAVERGPPQFPSK